MLSLYDRIAARPGGASDLAAARLRRRVLVLLDKAMESAGITERELAPKVGMSVRKLRRIMNGNGDVKATLLAELLHAAGYEADVRLVPAGEPRRAAITSGPTEVMAVWAEDWDSPEDSEYDGIA